MPQGRTGVTTNTANRRLLDAGVVYTNIGITELEATTPSAAGAFGDAIAVSEARILGAMTDDVVWALDRTLRDVPANGLLGPTKDFVRRQSVAATVTGTYREITSENLQEFIAAADTAVAGSFTKIYGGPIESGDYLDNIALATTYSDNDEPVVVVLKNVLVFTSPSLTTSPQDEGSMEIEFRAHFDPATPQDESSMYVLYHPGQSA